MRPEPGRLVFRDARPDDVPGMARMDELLFEHHAYGEDVFHRFFSSGNPVLVVENGPTGDLVGFVLLAIDPDQGMGGLVTLDVDPAWWRTGVGSALVGACARILTDGQPPTEMLWLTTATSNVGAIAFYQALGFEEVGSIPRYYRDEDAIVMLHEDVPSLAGLAPPLEGR
jgi:ribosomal protein S18 acetylase RimI-like enzyme